MSENKRIKEPIDAAAGGGTVEPKIYEFEAVIEPVPDKGGAYVLSL